MSAVTAGASAQELVEHALPSSRSDACVVIVSVSSSANLRWAGNTMTTNGGMERVSVTVVSFRGTGAGTAAGAVSSTAADLDRVTRLVERADAAAAGSDAAEDAAELVPGGEGPEWGAPPERTSIDVYAEVAPDLGRAF